MNKILASLCLASCFAFGATDFYSWIDANGRAQRYFVPIIESCIDDAVQYCGFNLTTTTSLKVKGNLTIFHDIAESECYGDVDRGGARMWLRASLNGIPLEGALLLKDVSQIESSLPDWFKAGFAGEVTLPVEVELYNVFDDFLMGYVAYFVDKGPCGNASYINAKNLKIENNKPLSIIYDRAWYEDIIFGDMWNYIPWSFRVKNDVSIFDKPNGRAIATVKKVDTEKSLLFDFERLQYNINGINVIKRGIKAGDNNLERMPEGYTQNIERKYDGWILVIYFPKAEMNPLKATIGYVKESELEPIVRLSKPRLEPPLPIIE